MKLRLPLLLGALAAAGFVAFPALAQTSAPVNVPAKVIGKAGQVQGLVTVSLGANVGSVAENAPIYVGSRYVTGSTGMLNLDFTDGCVVKLAPNQTVTIADDKPCDDRKGAVAWLSGGAVLAGGGGVSPLVGLAAVAGAAVVGNAIVNSGGGPTTGTGGGTPPGGGGTTPGGGGTTPGGGGTTPGGGGGIPNPPPSGQ